MTRREETASDSIQFPSVMTVLWSERIIYQDRLGTDASDIGNWSRFAIGPQQCHRNGGHWACDAG
jgi:hypothetical protein|eukprot:COSAG06_NODE_13_length_35352_cov_49.626255_22_plen_65_part_00